MGQAGVESVGAFLSTSIAEVFDLEGSIVVPNDGLVDLDKTCLSSVRLRYRMCRQILVDICGPQSPHGIGDCIDSSSKGVS
jgi:hypothetical protein